MRMDAGEYIVAVRHVTHHDRYRFGVTVVVKDLGIPSEFCPQLSFCESNIHFGDISGLDSSTIIERIVQIEKLFSD